MEVCALLSSVLVKLHPKFIVTFDALPVQITEGSKEKTLQVDFSKKCFITELKIFANSGFFGDGGALGAIK